MDKKYKLRTDLIKGNDGHILYRIESLKDFSNVKKGDLGGWVEKENNLSQEGNCWVYDNACVYDNAIVTNNATVRDEASVYGDTWVCENACVYGEAKVYDNAKIYGIACVYGESYVRGNTRVYGRALVNGKAIVDNEANICGNAVVKKSSDYYVCKNIWSSGRHFTYTHYNRMWSVGCFYGTGMELIKKAYKDSDISGRNYERSVKFVEEMYKDIEINKD